MKKKKVVPKVREVKRIQIEVEFEDFELLIEGIRHLERLAKTSPADIKKEGTTLREQVVKVLVDVGPLVRDMETAWRIGTISDGS